VPPWLLLLLLLLHALSVAAVPVYMVHCLILLVELTPKQHLALGIAVLSAGEGQQAALLHLA
jgi:hypothetical protein